MPLGAILFFETHTTVIPANHAPYPDTGAGIQSAALLPTHPPKTAPTSFRRTPESRALRRYQPRFRGRSAVSGSSGRTLALSTHSGESRNPERYAIANLDSGRSFRSVGERGAHFWNLGRLSRSALDSGFRRNDVGGGNGCRNLGRSSRSVLDSGIRRNDGGDWNDVGDGAHFTPTPPPESPQSSSPPPRSAGPPPASATSPAPCARGTTATS